MDKHETGLDIPITPLPEIRTGDGEEYEALEHLLKARYHARHAEKLFADGSKGESAANNTLRWADKSVDVATRYLEESDDDE